MARLSGQATSAALAALALGLHGAGGTTFAAALGAIFAAVGGIASVLRFFVGRSILSADTAAE